MNARPRQKHALGFPLAALAISLAAFFSLFAGCALSTQGIPGDGGDDGGAPCANDKQCDDKNPCTTDTCNTDVGRCEHTGVADGTPLTEQTAGDCKTTRCQDGMPEDQDDDDDIPDDNEACTIDTCQMGTAYHTAKMDGTACKNAQNADGRCDHGKCKVACTDSSTCVMGTTNPCVTPACDLSIGVCIYPSLPDGTLTPGVTQVPGDCHTRICLGGMDINQNDDLDVPVTATDCDEEKCTSGVPSNPPRAADEPCSTSSGQVCDGAGTCVQCNPTSVTKCPGTDTDCQERTCVNHTCGITNQPTATAAAQQIAGDCHKVYCDGMGGHVTLVDDTDKPVDPDGCHPGICTNGAPSNGVAMDGTTCGVGGTLACLGGSCNGCTNNTQCTAPSTCGGGGMANVCGCTPTITACNQTNPPTTCGTVSNGCGVTLNCGGAKNGGETDVDCGGGSSAAGQCSQKCGQGKKCNVNSDCTSNRCVDGVCCDTTCTGKCQACTAAKKGQGNDGVCGPIKAGDDPDGECPAAPQSSCGNVGGCNGTNNCTPWPNGTVCAAASCTNATLDKADTCVNGTCTPPNPNTQSCGAYQCNGAACGSSCTDDNGCTMGNWCSGTTCLAKKATGQACTAANQCTSGFCVDNVCCGTVCDQPCEACSAAAKQSGNNGTCGDAKTGVTDPRGKCASEPASTCGFDGKCAASAMCSKWPSGTVCLGPSCSGGTQTSQSTCDGNGTCGGAMMTPCTPYVCGATACLTSCGTGAAADDAKCITGDYCDGATGMCVPKVDPGAACSKNSACNSGICLGGHCCGSNGCITAGTCGASMCAMGTGACVYPVATVCTPGTCGGGGNDTLSNLKVCDDQGSCTAVSDLNCPNGACMANGCTSCNNDNQCPQVSYCNGTSCAAKKPSGAACADAKECLSNNCNTTCQ